jgi:TolB-like protein
MKKSTCSGPFSKAEKMFLPSTGKRAIQDHQQIFIIPFDDMLTHETNKYFTTNIGIPINFYPVKCQTF